MRRRLSTACSIATQRPSGSAARSHQLQIRNSSELRGPWAGSSSATSARDSSRTNSVENSTRPSSTRRMCIPNKRRAVGVSQRYRKCTARPSRAACTRSAIHFSRRPVLQKLPEHTTKVPGVPARMNFGPATTHLADAIVGIDPVDQAVGVWRVRLQVDDMLATTRRLANSADRSSRGRRRAALVVSAYRTAGAARAAPAETHTGKDYAQRASQPPSTASV